MPRIGIINMICGFALLCLASMAGAFIATEATQGFVSDPAILASWGYTLRKSSHAHTNLFGTLHILYGLTIPYSQMSSRVKIWQTIGLAAGSLGMSLGMIVRALVANPANEGGLDYLVGFALSLAMIALTVHVVGLCQTLLKR